MSPPVGVLAMNRAGASQSMETHGNALEMVTLPMKPIMIARMTSVGRPIPAITSHFVVRDAPRLSGCGSVSAGGGATRSMGGEITVGRLVLPRPYGTGRDDQVRLSCVTCERARARR